MWNRSVPATRASRAQTVPSVSASHYFSAYVSVLFIMQTIFGHAAVFSRCSLVPDHNGFLVQQGEWPCSPHYGHRMLQQRHLQPKNWSLPMFSWIYWSILFQKCVAPSLRGARLFPCLLERWREAGRWRPPGALLGSPTHCPLF